MAARSAAHRFHVSYSKASFAGASGTLGLKWPCEFNPQKNQNAHFATFHVEIPKIPSSSSADGPTMPYAHTSGTRGTAMAEKKEFCKTKNGPRKPNSPGLSNLYHSLTRSYTPLHDLSLRRQSSTCLMPSFSPKTLQRTVERTDPLREDMVKAVGLT